MTQEFYEKKGEKTRIYIFDIIKFTVILYILKLAEVEQSELTSSTVGHKEGMCLRVEKYDSIVQLSEYIFNNVVYCTPDLLYILKMDKYATVMIHHKPTYLLL